MPGGLFRFVDFRAVGPEFVAEDDHVPFARSVGQFLRHQQFEDVQGSAPVHGQRGLGKKSEPFEAVENRRNNRA